MSIASSEILNNKAINEWNLFWLITGPISIVMVVAMMGADLSSGDGVSSMIQLSVRCAVPLLYLAFAASSVQVLFPGVSSCWVLRNRKIIGLCFAAAMGWQLLFIVWLVTVYSDYYINEVYVLRDAIEGVVGYLFLIAMTLTSFRFGSRHLKPRTWKLLHKSGIYFLWAYAFSVYWWNLFYYSNPVLIDYVFYWGGLLACGARTAAWSKKRGQLAEKNAPQKSPQPVFRLVGWLIVGVGVIAASFGLVWRETADELLTGYAITQFPELYLPYWPFQPFLPLFIIVLGAFLITRTRA
jgi:DMSO/TMAO reductase YedYZ heme-binding membrane subunit